MHLDLRMAQHPVHGRGVSGAGVAELGEEKAELLAVTTAREPDAKCGRGSGAGLGGKRHAGAQASSGLYRRPPSSMQ